MCVGGGATCDSVLDKKAPWGSDISSEIHCINKADSRNDWSWQSNSNLLCIDCF